MFRAALFLLLCLTHSPLNAQTPSGLEGAVSSGPGITDPRLLHMVEPKYSEEANAKHVQGIVVLQIAIDENGQAVGTTVISPLGYGLDEQAQQAVEAWKFSPATKDGKPIKVLATVEVNFKYPGLSFDQAAEHQRTSFNTAFRNLNLPKNDTKSLDQAVKTIQDLSKQRFPAAMYMVGLWKTQGDHLPKDPGDGLALLQKAAAKNYGPALYQIAIRQIEGRDLPKDAEGGLKTMQQASEFGSVAAQNYLGNIYEAGNGVPSNLTRARKYFRMCAAKGVPRCQQRLGILLLTAPGRPERDLVQALAWLQLAGEQGMSQEAREIASSEAAKLTPEQTNSVATLKAKLVHK